MGVTESFVPNIVEGTVGRNKEIYAWLPSSEKEDSSTGAFEGERDRTQPWPDENTVRAEGSGWGVLEAGFIETGNLWSY